MPDFRPSNPCAVVHTVIVMATFAQISLRKRPTPKYAERTHRTERPSAPFFICVYLSVCICGHFALLSACNDASAAHNKKYQTNLDFSKPFRIKALQGNHDARQTLGVCIDWRTEIRPAIPRKTHTQNQQLTVLRRGFWACRVLRT